MKMGSGKSVLIFFLLIATTSLCFAVNVTYDSRALVINGKRRVLVSGSIHYPRSTPEMWPDLIKKSKEGGLDIIETYVFWDIHEPAREQFDFTGRKDLVKFLKLVDDAGLYVHLRIGPYVCAEWNYGGFPTWLHFIPGIQLRTDNEPYKAEMQRFVTKIVDMMKKEKLYASQGGPIILSQIENEYGNVQKDYGAKGNSYVKWSAQMADALDTGVPWVMCQQDDAPNPMINTCNGFYCDSFTPNSDQKPKFWTELWSGWFSSWGDPVPYRPVEDIAFAVARFYQRNGTLVNYYMYHGGSNFGRTGGGPFITTSYDYDAPLDEYGLLRQPKWGHLKDLHKAIKLCEPAMVATFGVTTSIGNNSEATVYKTESGLCAAFLSNGDNKSDITVNFNGISYDLPAWSVSILPDCKNVVYNTAQVNSMTAVANFVPQKSSSISSWSWFKEPVGISSKEPSVFPGLMEQLNVTYDITDYLWYSLRTNLKEDDPLLQGGSQVQLEVSGSNAVHVFVNDKLAGSGQGNIKNGKYSINVPVDVKPGDNSINLLSMTVGLQNYGANFDTVAVGITAPVKLKGPNNSTNVDLSNEKWTYQIGLKGEESELPKGSSSGWSSDPAFPKNSPLTWYKATFNAPPGNSPVAIDLTGMGKGHAWVNGQGVGRYWVAFSAPQSDKCKNLCDYKGSYSEGKCGANCGKPSQLQYHVPRSWLKPSGNVLVMLEEIGGDPTKISIVTRELGHFCAQVSETHPKPTLSLECPSPKQTISELHFVSYGNPQGTCGSFAQGQCRSKDAQDIVEKACIGKPRCSIEVSDNTFGNPCGNVTKSLAVEASCH